MRGFEKAMILAAGYGTRLLPLTENTPKALVKVNGNPMIKNVIDKLISCGIKEIVINVHYHADQLIQYFETNKFEADINLVSEENILGTGGGIKNAKRFLENSADFFVYNVDVSSEIDLNKMAEAHKNNKCLVTLATNGRMTTRPLLFNSDDSLVGRRVNNENFFYSGYSGEISEKAFCGIHIISSEIFTTFPGNPFFDIIDHYMELVEMGKKINSFDIGNTYWKDLGKLIDF